MAKTIHKWVLTRAELQRIEMPAKTELLTVQRQGDKICLWGIVDLLQPPVHRSIMMVGTGWGPYPDHVLNHYIGTVQEGPLVWHFFSDGGL